MEQKKLRDEEKEKRRVAREEIRAEKSAKRVIFEALRAQNSQEVKEEGTPEGEGDSSQEKGEAPAKV